SIINKLYCKLNLSNLLPLRCCRESFFSSCTWRSNGDQKIGEEENSFQKAHSKIVLVKSKSELVMENESEETNVNDKDKIKGLFPFYITVVIYTSLALLVVGAVVLLIFGILNFGHKLGPVLVGMSVALFVVSLMSFGLFWVCIKQEQLKNHQQPNARGNYRFSDDCPISVVNPHFNMGLPVSPHEMHLDRLDHFRRHNSDNEPLPSQYDKDHQQYVTYSVKDLSSTITPHDSPPSYWECIASTGNTFDRYEGQN
ncbi:hypothetical protein FKM82_021230, partial [Ascaphus truei]